MVSRGGEKVNRVFVQKYGLKYVLLQSDREVAAAYQVEGTPSAVVVGADGQIQSFLVSGGPAISTLVSQVVTNKLAVRGTAQWHVPLQKGAAAPDFSLPDLEGRSRTLAEFGGQSTLLLFWNPGCGFCRTMLPELRRWEERRINGTLRIVVVSTGSSDENAAMSLYSPILLDLSHEVMKKFGSGGTPSAVLIDADSKIASELAFGASAISALVASAAKDPVRERWSELRNVQAEARN